MRKTTFDFGPSIVKFQTFSGVLLTTIILGGANAQTCSSPTILNFGTLTSTLSTCNQANNYDENDACGNDFITSTEYVFKYTPNGLTNPNCVTIDLNLVPSTPVGVGSRGLFIFDGCPDNPSTTCIGQAITTTGTGLAGAANTKIENKYLTSGVDYYIVASAPFGCYSFNLAVNAGACTPPVPGQDCANAVNIPLLPFSQSANTCLAANDYNAGNIDCVGSTQIPGLGALGCRTFTNGDDFIYSYTPPNDECVNIWLDSVLFYTGLFILNGCPTDPSSIVVGSDVRDTIPPRINRVNLAGGQTYYIMISSAAPQTDCTPFKFFIKDTVCCGLGSTCLDPYLVPNLPYSHVGSTCGMCDDYHMYMACTNYGLNGEDVVYSYTAVQDGCVQLSMSDVSSGYAYDNTAVTVYDGCPNAPSTNCILSNHTQYNPQVNFTVSAGTTYTIVLSRAACTGYSLSIDWMLPDTVGNNCSDAEVLTSFPYEATDQSTSCYGNDFSGTNSTCGGFGWANLMGDDYTYKYTSAGNDTLTIELSNTSRNTAVYVYLGCPGAGGTCIAHAWSSTNSFVYLCNVVLNTPGDYYIQVDHLSTFADYDIKISRGANLGSSCSSAHTIPSLPFFEDSLMTRCRGNHNTSYSGCTPTAMNGEDYVFSYNSAGNEFIDVSLFNTGVKTAIYLLNGCPGAAGTNCLGSAYSGDYDVDPNLCKVPLSNPGTYYIIVDTKGEVINFDISVQVHDSIGVNCENPFVIDSIPFHHTELSTRCKFNDYNGNGACSSTAMEAGEEMVFELVLDSTSCLEFALLNATRSGAIYLTRGCPGEPGYQCINADSNTNFMGSSYAGFYETLAPGTYNIRVSSSLMTQDNDFQLLIEPMSSNIELGTRERLACIYEDSVLLSASPRYGYWTGPGITDSSTGVFYPNIAGMGSHVLFFQVVTPCFSVIDSMIITVDSIDCETCNFDLEKGTLASWSGYTGSCCGGSLNTPGMVANRHQIRTVNHIDPYIGSVVPPSGGSYVVQLGNNSTGAQAEKLIYNYPVNAPYIGFNYTVILEDPGHSYIDQPKLLLNIRDSADQIIPCGEVAFVPGANTPGFYSHPAYYSLKIKPWSSAVFDVSNYIGSYVEIEFITMDCGQSGHFGYAYLDGICDQVISGDAFCSGTDSIVLRGPKNFFDYQWSNGSTADSAVIYNPQGGDTVTLTLNPGPGLGCPVTLTFPLVEHSKTAFANLDSAICEGDSLELNAVNPDFHLLTWHSLGQGVISDGFPSYYHPDSSDIVNGSVSLVLQENVAFCTYFDTIQFAIVGRDTANFTYSQSAYCLDSSWISPNLHNSSSGYFYTNSTFLLDSLTGELLLHDIADSTILIFYNSLGYCPAIDSAQLSIEIPLSADFTMDSLVCIADSGWVNLQFVDVSGVVTSSPALVWADSTSWTLSVAQNNPGNYIIENQVSGFVCPTEVHSQSFTIVDYYSADFDLADSVCANLDLLQATNISNPGFGYFTSFPNGLNWSDSLSGIINITMSSPGSYVVRRIVDNAAPCQADTHQVTLQFFPVPQAQPFISDDLCEGDTLYYEVILGGSGPAPSANWTGPNGFTSNQLNGIIYPVSSDHNGVYQVQVSQNYCYVDCVLVVENIRAWSSAEIQAIGPFCIQDSNVILQCNDLGGIWTGNGVVPSGFFSIIGAGIGNHAIHYVNSATCKRDSSVVMVLAQPNPAIKIAPTEICVPDQIQLSDTSGDSYITYYWRLGDQVNNGISPIWFLNWIDTGCFDAYLTVSNGICQNTDTLISALCAYARPKAEFEYFNDGTDKRVEFTNLSEHAMSFLWNFGDGTTSTQLHPVHFFPDSPHSFEVMLIANSNHNCPDTVLKTIEIEERLIFYVPNSFTPDDDQHNSVFRPVFSSGVDPNSYFMQIYNRWGEVLFETRDIHIGWDGTFNGTLVQSGMYTWKIGFSEKRTDRKVMKTGSVHLLR